MTNIQEIFSLLIRLLLEIITDPLNWVTFGTAGPIKSGTKVVGKEATENIAQSAVATVNRYFAKSAGEITAEGSERITKQLTNTAADIAKDWTRHSFKEMSDEEKAKLQGLPTSLDAALDALEADHDYLTAGGVFPEELLKNFIKNKRAECAELSKIPHPAEFDKYYNL